MGFSLATLRLPPCTIETSKMLGINFLRGATKRGEGVRGRPVHVSHGPKLNPLLVWTRAGGGDEWLP